ncbi:putative trehalose-phosphatase [Lupinus albus]|uniref:Trehalose 6-phosphate phosphatase n=1 Tax=Lupinus albus TaxID=3870 RepID=A0A6A4PI89_LUPAL|nr:putative trehalose-phosphatase [Lupinus albus]
MMQQNVAVSDTKSRIKRYNRRVSKNLEINGEQRINSLVDSMRASSPTHAKSSNSLAEEQYTSWIVRKPFLIIINYSIFVQIVVDMKLIYIYIYICSFVKQLRHPSALDMFEQIVDASQGKQIVMFLDYDGTLSPIVNDPDRAFMSHSMRKTVRKLAKCFPTAIVTGRSIDKVYNFVRLTELYYAGSHGMDIKGPSKSFKFNKDKKSEEVLFQPANSEFIPMIAEVYQKLVEKTKSIAGAMVENNKFCASVHFRCVDEKKWSELAQKVRSVLKEYPRLHLTQGRKVLEIRPTIKWDKGMALQFLLESFGFANSTDVFPIYIGDDKTDEDAFKKLIDRGQGIGILVSKFPKDTSASYSLKEPNEASIIS